MQKSENGSKGLEGRVSQLSNFLLDAQRMKAASDPNEMVQKCLTILQGGVKEASHKTNESLIVLESRASPDVDKASQEEISKMRDQLLYMLEQIPDEKFGSLIKEFKDCLSHLEFGSTKFKAEKVSEGISEGMILITHLTKPSFKPQDLSEIEILSKISETIQKLSHITLEEID